MTSITYPLANQKSPSSLMGLMIIILIISLGVISAHTYLKHGQNQIQAIQNCPPDRIGMTLQSFSGNKLVLCQIENDKWGAVVQNESGETQTAFVNNIKSILRWAKNQGFAKVESFNPKYIEYFAKILGG